MKKDFARAMNISFPPIPSSLKGCTPQIYAEWLIKGLQHSHCLENGRKAFPDVSGFMDQRWNDHISEDLEDVHNCLDEADQENFRKGCVSALELLDINIDQDRIIAKTIMDLGSHINAQELLVFFGEKNWTDDTDILPSDLNIPVRNAIYYLTLKP